MDILGYAAFGGLERIAIIAGAMLIGYWGYRLYSAERPAGLAFLGVACVMLFGALLTGGSHVRSVSEGLQIASTRPVESTPQTDPASSIEDTAVAGADLTDADAQVAVGPDSAGTPAVDADAPIAPDAPDSGESSQTAITTDTTTPGAATAADGGVGGSLDEDLADRRQPLATAQELGGRILSVKSDQVSLEWSPATRDQ